MEFFNNKKILITGAAGGIGAAITEKFYNLNAKICATGSNEDANSAWMQMLGRIV